MHLQKLSSLLMVAALVGASPAAAAEVRVTMAGGLVTVSAKEATVGEILAEWGRVGQTRIVNIERLSGAPVTLELVNVPEAQALDTILRSVSGYLAAPRATPVPNASAYDRIFLLLASTGVAAKPAGATAISPTAFFPQPFQPNDDRDDEVDTRPGARVLGPGQGSAPPSARTGSAADIGQSPARTLAGPTPTPAPVESPGAAATTMPAGVSTPGMLVPVPQPQLGDPGARR